MELSLNNLAENIYSSRTKEYFQEVLSSYQIGNYRSAVVMLWSVVIYDLLHKLDHLDSRDNKKAQAILKDIEQAQKDNPRSPSWETDLLKKSQETLKLITISEYENLNYLQGQRHLCAHPAINNERKLHSPNKETVRSLIINALIDLLTKPPFYSKEIFEEILSDISDNQNHFHDNSDKLKKYLNSKYINHLNQDVCENIFSSLWKLVFKLDNPECTKNRKINFFALQAFVDSLGKNFLKVLENDSTKYNDINVKDEYLVYFIALLAKNNFYSIVKEDIKIHIENYISINLEAQLVSWFKEGDNELEKYFCRLEQWMIENDDASVKNIKLWELVYKKFDSPHWERKFTSIMFLYFKNSWSYDIADNRFSEVISPYIDKFDQTQLKELVEIINSNSQIYDRRQSKADNSKIFEQIKVLSIDLDNLIIDLSQYPNFKYYE